MNRVSAYVLPAFILIVLLIALLKKINVWNVFLDGVQKGLKCSLDIFPSIFGLVIAIDMLSASGALDAFSAVLSPAGRLVGIPKEILPLTLMRSVSGSGATAVFQNILTNHGPDSYIGRCASVIMGSTETTFYTITVYFAAARAKDLRYCVFCALLADLTGSVVGCIMCRLFY